MEEGKLSNSEVNGANAQQNASTGQENGPGHVGATNTGTVQGKSWWLPAWTYFPWSDDATIGILGKVADLSSAGYIGLLTLFAMYLWAWAKQGSVCIPSKTEDSKVYHPSAMQVLVGILPFIVWPAVVSIGGMARGLKTERGRLGTVATLCLFELIGAVVLGAAMLTCMTGWLIEYIAIGAFVLAMLIVFIWSLSFKHPKFLRYFVWSTCFRQTAEEANRPPRTEDMENH